MVSQGFHLRSRDTFLSCFAGLVAAKRHRTVPVTDRLSGAIRQAANFVAVLGATNYTSCEASRCLISLTARATGSTQ